MSLYFRPQLIESEGGLICVAADQHDRDALEAMMAAELRKAHIFVTEPLPEDAPAKFMVHEICIDKPNRRFILQRSRTGNTPEGIWLRALEPGAVFRDVDGRERPITRRLALDDRGRLFIRAAGVGGVPGFFNRFLEPGKPLPPPRQYQPGEQTVRPRVRIRLPLVFRCVLKTGFNLLAHSCGRSAATDPAFDVLRRELFDSSQDESIMRRCRFLGIRPWWQAWLPDSFPAPGTDAQHRMMLDIHRGRLRFRLRLYGYLGYSADLGSVSAALARRIPSEHEACREPRASTRSPSRRYDGVDRPRIPGLPRCSARRAAQSSGNQTRSSPRLRRRCIPWPEARSSENAAPRKRRRSKHTDHATLRRSNARLSSSWFAPSRFMATKLNCFDSGKESRCRESVSRKSYDSTLAPLKNEVGNHPTCVFTYVNRNRSRKECGSRCSILPNFLGPEFWKTRNALGLDNLRLRDLRHNAATQMVRTTGNLGLLQKMLRHKRINTKMRYAHVTEDDLRDALTKVSPTAATIHAKFTQEPEKTLQPIDNKEDLFTE